jgi:soluble lytic murein transglycosylase
VTDLPADGITACRLAAERKRCGYEADAWSRFQALELQAAEDPAVAAWIDANADQFRWGTSQYRDLASTLADRYAEKPNAELAWQRYRALARGGDWAGAEKQLVDGASAHGGRFRNREQLGRAQLLSGNYRGARETFEALGKSGGAFGREARWLAAFAAWRAGDDVDALTRLDRLVGNDDWTGAAARYYRVRVLDRLGRKEEAAAGRSAILTSDPWSWYAALLDNDATLGTDGAARQGRWPGARPPALPAQAAPGTAAPAVAVNAGALARPVEAVAVDWAALRWEAGVAAPPAVAPPAATAAETSGRRWGERPEAYGAGAGIDPAAGVRLLNRLGEEHADLFPDAVAAADLARAGLFDLAAPLVARMYDRIDPAVGGTAHPEVTLSVSDWRQVFLLVRDHYHVARFSWGLHKYAATDTERRDAWRLTYPTAEADALWRHGERYDVDPLMALGLMRQESVYRQWALSPVGAVGLMQVMPRTGARIAARMGDDTYSPDRLQDPATNVRYGVWYLSMLLDRFGGAWPLAVASYNGGPHNVSAWLRPFGDQIPMDDFVESMPYPETRDYVKKVAGYYLAYIALYGHEGDHLRIPMRVTKDDATVVNF